MKKYLPLKLDNWTRTPNSDFADSVYNLHIWVRPYTIFLKNQPIDERVRIRTSWKKSLYEKYTDSAKLFRRL